MYWVSLILTPIFFLTLKYLKEEFFPIPEKIRGIYIARCVFGMISNVLYIFSLEYISFSEATVIFWTCPVFTTIIARYVLKENLTSFDWFAVLAAFFGILLI
jgi:drug/metabolite transporter (DMT)-like permease